MRNLTAATVLATSLVLAGGMLGALPSSAAPAPAVQALVASSAAMAAEPQPAPGSYTPPRGVKFNDPLAGAASRRNILDHLIRTVNSVPGGEKIRVASWNIRSDDFVDALVRAHHRGVSVRAILDRLNSNKDNPNPSFNRLTTQLRRHQVNRPASMKSYTRRCVSACRAAHGIAHTKFFLFTEAGKARHVVIYGSNNATDLAAYGQWNDVFTVTGKSAMYADFDQVFNQMARDRNVSQPYLDRHYGDFTSYVYPYVGDGTSRDPLLRDLGHIVCSGATGGSGINGMTAIRIAQTSMHGERGIKIAERLRTMWQRGCNIKIVYAVFGNEVLRVLRNTSRGPVPLRQIAQDHNLDGVYDRYLHMKSMAVSGRYKDSTNANVTWNGSANWTSVALASDEIVMRIHGSAVRERYSQWIDHLYANPPRYQGKQATLASAAMKSAIANGIDPYSQIQVN